jgi:hypothetical protein
MNDAREVAQFERHLALAEAIDLSPQVRMLVADARRLFEAYTQLQADHARTVAELKRELADANALAEMRFKINSTYAKENEKLISERLELLGTIERHIGRFGNPKVRV